MLYTARHIYRKAVYERPGNKPELLVESSVNLISLFILPGHGFLLLGWLCELVGNDLIDARDLEPGPSFFFFFGDSEETR